MIRAIYSFLNLKRLIYTTIRIESLNAANNINNHGTKLAPVFEDGNGDLTLSPPNGTGGEPLNFLLDIPNFIPDNPHSLPFDSGVVVNNFCNFCVLDCTKFLKAFDVAL